MRRIIAVASFVLGLAVAAACGRLVPPTTIASLTGAHPAAAATAACSTPSPKASASVKPSPSPTPTPIPTAKPTAAPTSTASGTVVWQAGSATLGKWIDANTYQCGSPSVSGAQFTFDLVRNGTNCGRNQAMPEQTAGQGEFPLSLNMHYTWTFKYIDGTPSGSAPGMGPDSNAESLIWQSGGSCERHGGLALGFVNDPKTGSQEWTLTAPGTTYLWGDGKGSGYAYTPGETDNWQISLYFTDSTAGSIQLYRNNTLVYSAPNVQTAWCTSQWWNFGVYKWRWEISGGGGSDMTTVNATIDDMTLVQNS